MYTANTLELTGTALDYAIAVALGFTVTYDEANDDFFCESNKNDFDFFYLIRDFKPSTDVITGNKIIDNTNIHVKDLDGYSVAHMKNGYHYTIEGDTSIIAAMRCFVVNTIGDTIQIPLYIPRKNKPIGE